jgi:metal-dependent amidase/aminoacylase/carboxypeptidase family protein
MDMRSGVDMKRNLEKIIKEEIWENDELTISEKSSLSILANKLYNMGYRDGRKSGIGYGVILERKKIC